MRAYTWGVRLENDQGGAVTTYTLTLMPFGDVPASGRIVLTFPAGTDLSGVTSVTTTSPWGGTFSFSSVGEVLTVSRNNDGNMAPELNAQNLIISGIVNTDITNPFHSIVVEIRDGTQKVVGNVIDFPKDSNCFIIIPAPVLCLIQSHSPGISETNILLTSKITCTFDSLVSNSSVHSNSFYLQDSGWNYVPANYNVNGTIVTLSPVSGQLQPNEYYTVTLTTNIGNTAGNNLAQITQWHFRTGPGNETGHNHNMITLDGNLSDWDSGNNVAYNGAVSERVADDADTAWGHTDQLWSTWDLDYFYMAIKKGIDSFEEWIDYIAIDTTRDDQGAIGNPAGVNAFNYSDNRRPEYLLWLNHNNIFNPTWVGWRIYEWDGVGWIQNEINESNRENSMGEILEVRLSWTDIFGYVRNRISVCAYSYSNAKVNDFCPENISGPTNWITIDPDNNDDEIPDGSIMIRIDHFEIQHDGTSIVSQRESFTIKAIDNYNGIMSNYTGIITIDTSKGTFTALSFSNHSGQGVFTSLGNGRAEYQWSAVDSGVVTIYIKDNIAEAVNIRIESLDGYADDDIEGDIVFMPAAQISIIKTGTPDPVNVSGIITYKIVITNLGGFTAYDIKIEDVIPFGTTYESNSLKHGDTSSTFADAALLTEQADDDKGYFSGSSVIFCGPNNVTAPNNSGALLANSAWVVYFQVRVNAQSIVFIPGVLFITNNDPSFDGFISSEGVVSDAGYLKAGDAAGGSDALKIYQSADDRDHNIGWYPYSGGYFERHETEFGGYLVLGDAYHHSGSDDYDERILMTFSLGDVSAGVTITSATLYLKQFDTYGGGPNDYPLRVDHIKYSNIYDATTQLDDRYYCTNPRAVIEDSYFTIANSGGLPGDGNWLAIPSTNQVQYALDNLKAYSDNGSYNVFQVRIRDNFVDGGGSFDVRFHSQNDVVPGNRPYLAVHYDMPGTELRAFTGFNLDGLPDAANITEATLHLYRNNIEGDTGDFAPVRIDHIDFSNSLKSWAFDVIEIESGFMNFGAGAGNWAEVSVVSQVQYALDNPKIWTKDLSDKWFQIRLRPSGVNLPDSESDLQNINSVDTGNNLPYLKVYYDDVATNANVDIVTNIAIIGTNTDSSIINVIALPPAFTNFQVWHDGTNGTINQWKYFELRALDQYGQVYTNYTGVATLYVESAFAGIIEWTNINGNGAFNFIGGNKAVYTYAASDKGVISLAVRDDTVESIDPGAVDDAGRADNDAAPQFINFTGAGAVDLMIIKAIESVTFAGFNSRPIPGGSIVYRLYYTNAGAVPAVDGLIYDGLMTNITFFTSWGGTGWSNQWSTNIAPGQDYGSGDYQDTMPAKSKIKWVRWKKATIPSNEADILYYKVIIK